MGLFAVSPHGQYKVWIRPEVEEIRDGRGHLVRPSVPEVIAHFNMGGGIPDYARKSARERLDFRGVSMDEDPLARMGWFDLELAAQESGWDTDTQQQVEAELRRLDGDGFIIVERAPLRQPYPRYDQHRKVHGRRTVEHAIQDIVSVFESAGFDVEDAVGYERETLNDPRVIEALEALTATEEGETDTSVIAA